MPVPIQKAMGKLGMIEVFLFGSVTTRATNRRLKVRMASMNIPWTGIRPGAGLMAPKVF